MFCPKCVKEDTTDANDAKFCAACGSRLVEEASDSIAQIVARHRQALKDYRIRVAPDIPKGEVDNLLKHFGGVRLEEAEPPLILYEHTMLRDNDRRKMLITDERLFVYDWNVRPATRTLPLDKIQCATTVSKGKQRIYINGWSWWEAKRRRNAEHICQVFGDIIDVLHPAAPRQSEPLSSYRATYVCGYGDLPMIKNLHVGIYENFFGVHEIGLRIPYGEIVQAMLVKRTGDEATAEAVSDGLKAFLTPSLAWPGIPVPAVLNPFKGLAYALGAYSALRRTYMNIAFVDYAEELRTIGFDITDTPELYDRLAERTGKTRVAEDEPLRQPGKIEAPGVPQEERRLILKDILLRHTGIARENGVYLAPDIPDKKLVTPLKKYGYSLRGEEPLVLVESTPFSGFGCGLLLTDQRLYSRFGKGKVHGVAFQEMRDIILKPGALGHSIHVNGVQVFEGNVMSKDFTGWFCRLLQDIASTFRAEVT